jgi:hypothetical protein
MVTILDCFSERDTDKICHQRWSFENELSHQKPLQVQVLAVLLRKVQRAKEFPGSATKPSAFSIFRGEFPQPLLSVWIIPASLFLFGIPARLNPNFLCNFSPFTATMAI